VKRIDPSSPGIRALVILVAFIGVISLGILAQSLLELVRSGRTPLEQIAVPRVGVPGGTARVELALRDTSIEGKWSCFSTTNSTPTGVEPPRFRLGSSGQEWEFRCDVNDSSPVQFRTERPDAPVVVTGKISVPDEAPEGAVSGKLLGHVTIPKKTGEKRFDLVRSVIDHELQVEVISIAELDVRRRAAGHDIQRRHIYAALGAAAVLVAAGIVLYHVNWRRFWQTFGH
jgi:hypothetical protein